MKHFLCLIVGSLMVASTADAHDIVLRKEGKAVLGISYPGGWKQVIGKNHVIATSADGQAWSVASTLEGVKDHKSGIAKIKEGIEKYLDEIKFDETTKTESGSLVLSGTGKGKKTGVDIVFTSAVFESGKGRFSGLVFLVDASIEKYYEKAILAICNSILIEDDFAAEDDVDPATSDQPAGAKTTAPQKSTSRKRAEIKQE